MFVANNPMFLRRVGPAQFERRPTIEKHRKILVGQRDEAPLIPPYSLCNFKCGGAIREVTVTGLVRLPCQPVGCFSVAPALMPDRQAVEGVSVEFPLGLELVHQGGEAVIVRWFQQVNHLMHNDVLSRAFQNLRIVMSRQASCTNPRNSPA